MITLNKFDTFWCDIMSENVYRNESVKDYNLLNSSISKFSNILELSKFLEIENLETNTILKLSSPISIDQLEMLEAELHNQGILSKTIETISQRVRHDAGLLGWHARRFGISPNQIEFLVDVPKYIIKKAQELEEETKSSTQNSTLFPRELSYLDQFSSFILGKFDNTENKYEDALNVVLNVLIKSAERSKHLSEAVERDINEKIHIMVLPKNRAQFLKELGSS